MTPLPHPQAVLETIRDLMNAECVVPDWLHDVFLGYGDPAAAHYARCNRNKTRSSVDRCDHVILPQVAQSDQDAELQ